MPSDIKIPVGRNQTFYKVLPNVGKIVAVKGETFLQGGRVFGIEKSDGFYSVTDTATGAKAGKWNNHTRKEAVAEAEKFIYKIKNMDKNTASRVNSAEKEMQKYLRKKRKK